MKSLAFIDAGILRPNICKSRFRLNSDQLFDWKLFVNWMNSLSGEIFDFHYFDAISPQPSLGLEKYHVFLRSELKFKLHFMPLHLGRRACPKCGENYCIDEQKGVDVSIALTMIKLASHYDQAYLISGDGDLEPVVHEIRDTFGRKVSVIGWDGGIAPSLKMAANNVIYLEDHRDSFIRNEASLSPTQI